MSHPASETKWIIITGGPSCGKTSLLSYLNYLGFATVPESARLWIELEMSRGLTLDTIRKNELLFQEKVLKMKKDREENTPKDSVIFWDRGIHDSIAYGVDRNKVLSFCRHRYQKVFYLEPVGFVNDHVRVENEKRCLELGEKVLQSYEEDGYTVIRVPKMPIVERTQWILDTAKNP